ncbi:YbaB/EbfC family nucleoid-associated protein [Nonomuraea sp. NPDC059194]|uniref:YbaB/EbfC family nucleoid-associated protein n=1 Tax=Nonomuraea sp. NPDC059194 TaxID=3346764 RepID=UPI0036A42778
MKHAEAFDQGRIGDLDGLIRELDGWNRTLNQALTGLAENTLEGSDPTGTVHAQVSGTGRLLALTLDPRKHRDLDHLALAQAVQQAILAAKLAIGDHLNDLVDDLAGPHTTGHTTDDPLAHYINNVLREG